MGKEEIYNQIAEILGELRAVDAVGLAKSMIVEEIRRALAGEEEASVRVAVFIRLINSAEKEINLDELDPEERKLLSENFIKSLEGVKWYLFGAEDKRGETK
ncbi:hypothetical protein [Candidatus Ventrimonas sp.]|uniref:hypothetical protein n=1 Tax=Candidatus Ventrimonas sp. TaxID=3048889 RepID=UPI003AB2A4AC